MTFDSSWFPSAVATAAQALRQAIEDGRRRGPPPPPADFDGQRIAILVGGSLAALGAALFGLVRLLGAPAADPDASVFHLISGLGFIGIAAGTAFWTWRAQRLDPSRRELAHLAQVHGLSQLDGVRLTGRAVGHLPWFDTDELVTDAQHCAHVLLAGEINGRSLAYLECDHVIDPAATNQMVRSLGVLAVGRMKRLALRGMDAVVFLDPLDVPDLLIIPYADPAIGHYQKVLHERGATELTVDRELSRRFWIAAADPDTARVLLDGSLGTLLRDVDWCIVQLLGGHLVYIGSKRPKTVFRPEPRPEGTIEENLSDATELIAGIERLAGTTPAEPAQQRGQHLASSRPDAAASPVAVVQAPTERGARSGSSGWFLLIGRLVCGGVGAVSLFLALAVFLASVPPHLRGTASVDWPSSTATITHAHFAASDGRKGTEYKPELGYDYEVKGREYTGSQLQYGLIRIRDRSEYEAFVQKYTVGAQVPVYYDPEVPSRAVLRVGLHPETSTGGALFCLVFFSFIGLGGLSVAAFGGRLG